MKYLLILLLLPLLAACEEVVDADLPYIERLVVSCALVADAPNNYVFISRTVPVNTPLEDTTGVITDVVGEVIDDTGGRYRLRYAGIGYYAIEGLVPRSGHRYTLVVEWHGKRVTGSTLVPFPADIVSADTIQVRDSFEPWRDSPFYKMKVVIRPHGAQVYGTSPAPASDTLGPHSFKFGGHSEIVRRRDTSADGLIHVADEYWLDGPIDETIAVVRSFDEPYYDFSMTDYEGQDNGPFSTGSSEATRWNVDGDGFGLFIGTAIAWRRLE